MDGDLWHCTRGRDQDHPQEKEIQKSKCLSKKALQIDGQKERYIHLKAQFQRKQEIRKPSSAINAKK